jgi:hypothetical protein
MKLLPPPQPLRPHGSEREKSEFGPTKKRNNGRAKCIDNSDYLKNRMPAHALAVIHGESL